ncbi:MAG: SDR family NAD(P)-dependent oxidoreductase [Thermodesulfobacteriota bacterium]
MEKKVALVTGAAKNLGKAIAIRLATEGCNIIINDIDDEGLLQTKKEILALGRKCLARKTDVTNVAEVDKLVEEGISIFNRIDILVNNAGGSLNTPRLLEEATEEDWDKVINLNLKGTFFCCKAVVPYMKRNNYGSIINISSLAARCGEKLLGVNYAAAKAGVLGLTKKLALELGSFNIRVNAIALGLTISGERVKKLIMERTSEVEREAMLNVIPLRRFGEPKDLAGVVYFLCSDDSSYITGATIDVNGGACIS